MATVECLGADGLLLNQNIDAITAIFSAGTPQIYSLFCFSPPCLSNQFRLNHNPPPHLFSSLFPLSHHPSSSLKFCIPTWSMCNDLAGLRQILYPRLFTEGEREREKEREREREKERERGSDVNVTLTVTTDVTNTSGCIRTFSPPHTLAHTHTITSGIDRSQAKLQFFFVSLQITSVKQITSHKMRARYTVSGVELEGNLVVLYLEKGGCWWETQWK